MARPVLELHGYLRTRAELFHNFSLGRSDLYEKAMWPVPADSGYAAWSEGQLKPYSVNLCGNDASRPEMCKNKSQAGANLRFRVNPELHISDNLRIMSQIDMLDNLVLGSTPVGYANQPSSSGGYVRTPPSGYTPLGVYNASVDPPVAGVNSYANSITVKRVWGEYLSPVGLFRFGRMPSHWGLGMVENSGDGFDSDYHTTVDRLMFTTGLKSFDLYFSAAWDFPNEGATSQTPGQQQGQPFDLSQLDDVNQYVVIIARKKPAAVQRLALSRGDVVLNGGVHFAYRHQFLANDSYGSTSSSQNLGATSDQVQDGYVRRNARIVIPDLWLQLLYRGFRFEAEAVMIRGSMDNTAASGSNYENTTDPSNNGHKVKQYGVSTQTEYRAVDNRLSLQFGFGWASGDPDVVGPQVGGLTPGSNGLQPQRTSDRTDSTFRFHPDYRVDLILHRHILSRVQGTYYFRPSLDYDFSRKPNGQKIGGGASVIWTRASEFVQAPGHKRDLGIELNAQLYFQSKDGSLNDDPEQMGGFYTLVQYGVLFPLGGLGYLPGEVSQAANQNIGLSTSAAHTLRWYCGIFF
ncbi:MAG: TIGR04551 family protein [Polyangiaceae bacterium]|nr:TIGR04551 family protein [Polyangiaceae bacterium]